MSNKFMQFLNDQTSGVLIPFDDKEVAFTNMFIICLNHITLANFISDNTELLTSNDDTIRHMRAIYLMINVKCPELLPKIKENLLGLYADKKEFVQWLAGLFELLEDLISTSKSKDTPYKDEPTLQSMSIDELHTEEDTFIDLSSQGKLRRTELLDYLKLVRRVRRQKEEK